jgi:hypothetical protein
VGWSRGLGGEGGWVLASTSRQKSPISLVLCPLRYDYDSKIKRGGGKKDAKPQSAIFDEFYETEPETCRYE